MKSFSHRNHLLFAAIACLSMTAEVAAGTEATAGTDAVAATTAPAVPAALSAKDQKAADKKAAAEKKAADKAAAAQAKTDAAAAKAPAAKLEQNGVTRPASGKTKQVWDVADEMSVTLKAPVDRKALTDRLLTEGLVVGTIHTQYGKWRKYHGLVTVKETPAPAAPAAETPAVPSAPAAA